MNHIWIILPHTSTSPVQLRAGSHWRYHNGAKSKHGLSLAAGRTVKKPHKSASCAKWIFDIWCMVKKILKDASAIFWRMIPTDQYYWLKFCCVLSRMRKRVAAKKHVSFSECQEEENRATRCWSIHSWISLVNDQNDIKWPNRSKCYLMLADFCHGCSNIRANIRYISNIFVMFIPKCCSKFGASLCFAMLRCQIQFIQDGPAVGWAVKGTPLDGATRLVENDRCDVFGWKAGEIFNLSGYFNNLNWNHTHKMKYYEQLYLCYLLLEPPYELQPKYTVM